MAAKTATRLPLEGQIDNMEDSRRSTLAVAVATAMALPPPPPRNIQGLPPGAFQVAVVGLGMVGAAAARHLSKVLGSSVVAVGPPEPESVTADGPFGSHYDQGRLARVSDPDGVWAELASVSMSRYAELETISGIKFHYPVGSIRVEPAADGAINSLAQCFAVGKAHGGTGFPIRLVKSRRRLKKLFPCFGFRPGEAAVVEGGAAGYVNPRAMVAAQIKAAEMNGACVVREAVAEITPLGYGVRVKTTNGRAFWAKKVVICAGAYAPELLPCRRLRRLDMKCYGRTVLMAEVDKNDAARLDQMPTFIWRLLPGGYLSWVYGCPPIEYPDGRVLLKMGGTAYNAPDVSGASLGPWFRVPSIHVDCPSALHVDVEARHTPSGFTHAIQHSGHASSVDHLLKKHNIKFSIHDNSPTNHHPDLDSLNHKLHDGPHLESLHHKLYHDHNLDTNSNSNSKPASHVYSIDFNKHLQYIDPRDLAKPLHLIDHPLDLHHTCQTDLHRHSNFNSNSNSNSPSHIETLELHEPLQHIDVLELLHKHIESFDLHKQLQLASNLEFSALCSTFHHLFPNTRPISLHSKQCVVAFTADNRPYIDAVDGIRSPHNARVFVAAGGCGAAAKSSDEIGRLVSDLVINGRWNYHLDHSLFKAKFNPL